MKFTRTKRLVFFNNKWGVGKTTIAYNTAVKFAQHGYKTVLVDLDPQCNLSKLTLWTYFDESLFSNTDNVYEVLRGIIEWWKDVDYSISFTPVIDNLFLLPWSLKLSRYENLLTTAYNQAAAWEKIGYFQTSAISRFLWKKGLDEDIDIFIIDVSPNLWLLNRIILLGADYFSTPLMPDAFSLQWVENLGITLEERKKNWKNTGRALSTGIPSEEVLSGEGLFIGYIMNSYNQYAKKPIKSHEEWINKIPLAIKEYISEKHSKNWLVQKSWENSLINLKDYWELSSDSHIVCKAIFDLVPWKDFKSVQWTLESRELSGQQFESLFSNIEDILHKY